MTMVWSSEYGAVDGDFADVSLLLKGEGTNGSTTIVDSSSNNLSVTANNGAQISTAQSKFGSSSIEFLSSANTGLSVSPNTDFQFGTGDWTVEAWIYQKSLSQYATLFEVGNHLNLDSFVIITGTNNSNGLLVYSGAFYNAPTTGTINTNQWQFVTVSRSGNSLYFSVDGTVDTPVSFSRNLTSTTTVSVGYPYGFVPSANNSGFRFDGYISNLRITKGVARYTENFDVPTAPFPILSPSGRITIADDSLDADARQYIINVEEQDGQALEPGVRTAINNFVVGCKSDGIWNAIKASCLLSGARTLEGALVPLKGSAPTNFNFTLSDYDRELGLLANGSTKYLDSNRNNNTDLQDDRHLSVWVSTAATISNFGGDIGFYSASNGSSYIGRSAGAAQVGLSSLLSTLGSSSVTGFRGVTRIAGSSYDYRAASSTTNIPTNSTAPAVGNINVFRAGVGLYANSRLAFYSIGSNLDLALLDTRISDFITAIGAAI